MKLVTFTHDGATRIGALVNGSGDDYVLDLHKAEPKLPADMIALLAAGQPALALARRTVKALPPTALLPAAGVALLAPLPKPGKILCLGHNYKGHTASNALPEHPTIFAKFPSAVIGPGQPIVKPAMSEQVDNELELGVVIGKRTRNVAEKDALGVIAGYTCFNDVSARDVVRLSTQWTLGKSFDTFAPMGPALVTSDEVGDPGKLDIWLTLNGEIMQQSNTSDMIFPIPFLIAYISRVCTLDPGDVIATGTPSKVGTPPRSAIYLKAGDEVKLHIEKVGDLVNPVVAE
jgi:acylpyruvate hydrolase